MSQKLFTLIDGKQVHFTPGKKIIPAASFSKVVEALDVLEHVKHDADQYRREVIQECEDIKEKAFNEGYAEGFNKWAEHLINLEKELEKAHEELQKLVLPVALGAAKKIVSREIELSEDAILSIVTNTLKSIAQHKKIVIYVNKQDLEVLEKNKPQLRSLFESLESMSIRPRDDVSPGGCIIETEVGIINAQLEHRWGILERAFETLMQNKR